MSVTSYPTLRLKLTMPQALKLQFLPAIPGTNAAAAAAEAIAAAGQAQTAADTAVAATADKVSKSGDVMSGFLTLNANPNTNLQAATKQYVDAHASGIQTINSQDGPAVTLVAGTNITIDSPAADQIRIAAGAAGIPDAPSDGSLYGRFNATWAQAQPLDADLTSLAGASATNQWYYRSAADTWSPVTIGANLTFTGGTLAATGGGAPTTAQYITSALDATLTNERVLTDTASITWDFGTAGQAKAQRSAITGDVTAAANATVATIANDAVTYAKMQNVSATSRFIGRITTGPGDPEELTGAQATTLLDPFTSALKGIVPASGGGTATFLRADGTFATPVSGGAPTTAEYITASADATLSNERVLTNTATVIWDFTTPGQAKATATGASGGSLPPDGTYTDIAVTSSGTIWTVRPAVITYSKIQNVSATNRFLGRITAGAGGLEELTGANAKTILGSGDLTKTDDTNVTLTLGGTPAAALYSAVSLTLGWAGTLSVARGGLGVGTITGLMQGNGTGAVTGITNSSTVGQVLRVTGATTYAWGALDLANANAVTGLLPFANVTGAAPVGAEYITSTGDATLTAERVLTDTATVTWDRTVAGQIKANAAGGGDTAPTTSRQPLNINSGMMVAQEFGGVLQSGLANTGLWSVDGFQFATVNDGVFSSQQLAVATPGGSLNRLAIGVTTADATIAAGQYAFLRAAIEGYDAARLGWGTAAAKPIVVRLGVRPPVAGTFTLTIQNAVSNRNYLVPITFSAGEIGTDVTRYITIPGDTSGTWDTTNGIGLYVLFVLAIGTTYQGSASAWQAGNLFGVSGMSNGIGAVGTWHFFDWAIYDATGLASGVAPPFECPIYSAELLRCRRRFVYETALGWLYVDGVVASTATYLTIPVRLDQPMRAMPTLTLPAITLVNVSAPIVFGLSVSGFTLLAQSTSSVLARGYYLYASGALKLDARF